MTTVLGTGTSGSCFLRGMLGHLPICESQQSESQQLGPEVRGLVHPENEQSSAQHHKETLLQPDILGKILLYMKPRMGPRSKLRNQTKQVFRLQWFVNPCFSS